MRFKNQRGAISVFVLLAMLFFLVFMMSAYAITSRKVQTQTMSLSQLQYYYKKDADTIAATKYASSSNIPIYNFDQLKLAGSDTYAVVDNKVYLFKPDGSYQLKNNIVIDLNEYVKNPVFVDWKVDPASGTTTYDIRSNGYNIYYYKDGAYWKLVNYQDLTSGSNNYTFSSTITSSSVKQQYRYSVMDQITGYRYDFNNDGAADGYEFLLMYGTPGFNSNGYMRWRQTQSPNESRSGDAVATGYNGIYGCPSEFKGLLRSSNTNYFYSGNSSTQFQLAVLKYQTSPQLLLHGNATKAYLFARVDMR